MAIEFDCPYCTATIRVPDAYGGQQGRCPKCDTRLLVPMVVRPGSTTVPDSMPRTAGDPQSPVFGLPATEAFSVKPPVAAVTRRRRGRRRPSRALIVGIPVIGFLILLAVIFFSVTGAVDLSGELSARRVEETTLPAVTIPWSEAGVSTEQQVALQEFLATNPQTLASEVMTCRLLGTADGIEVRLTAGEGNEWIAVETSGNKALALWKKKERPRLNAMRLTLLHESLAAYCRDKLAQIEGQKVQIDGMSVRDNIGINACGDALSFVVQSEAASRAVLCAYEDDEESLYFCLPRGTQMFPIRGRKLRDSTTPFSGEFTAVVASLSRPPTTGKSANAPENEPSTETSAPDADSADDSEMKDDETDPPAMDSDSDKSMQSRRPSKSKKMDAGMMSEESMDSGMMDQTEMMTPKKRSK